MHTPGISYPSSSEPMSKISMLTFLGSVSRGLTSLLVRNGQRVGVCKVGERGEGRARMHLEWSNGGESTCPAMAPCVSGEKEGGL